MIGLEKRLQLLAWFSRMKGPEKETSDKKKLRHLESYESQVEKDYDAGYINAETYQERKLTTIEKRVKIIEARKGD